jgi:hypothetical protein
MVPAAHILGIGTATIITPPRHHRHATTTIVFAMHCLVMVTVV